MKRQEYVVPGCTIGYDRTEQGGYLGSKNSLYIFAYFIGQNNLHKDRRSKALALVLL